MIVLGLLLLVVAVVLAVIGVLSNLGSSHLLGSNFEVLGYHITGSSGRLFLYGIILGAAGMLGLNLLLAGLGRGLKRRVSTRRQLKADRKENERLAHERDELSQQLEQERTAKLSAGAGAHDERLAGSTGQPLSEGTERPGARQAGRGTTGRPE